MQSNPPDAELCQEKQRRQLLEKELKDKEYELLNCKKQHNVLQDSAGQAQLLKKDNEMLRDALEKEQENAYALLKDIHKHVSDNKTLKEQLEDKIRDTNALQKENKR